MTQSVSDELEFAGRLLDGALRQISHIVKSDPHALAYQLAGALMAYSDDNRYIRALLNAIHPPLNTLMPLNFDNYPTHQPYNEHLVYFGDFIEISLVGVYELPNGHLLTWDMKGRLCLWDTDITLIQVIYDKLSLIYPVTVGVYVSPNGFIWGLCNDKNIRVWDFDGQLLHVLTGHQEDFGWGKGFLLPDGRFISTNKKETIFWDAEGHLLNKIEDSFFHVENIIVINDAGHIRIYDDSNLLFFDEKGVLYNAVKLNLHQKDGSSGGFHVINLENGHLLTWENPNDAYYMYNRGHGIVFEWGQDGYLHKIVGAHEKCVFDIEKLQKGGFVSWGGDHHLCVWDDNFRLLCRLVGHEGRIMGVMELQDGRLLSWAEDFQTYLWDILAKHDDKYLRKLKPQAAFSREGWLEGATQFADGSILTWEDEYKFSLWNVPKQTIQGQEKITPIKIFIIPRDLANQHVQLRDGRIISYRQWYQNRVWLWDVNLPSIDFSKLHDGEVSGLYPLSNGTILSWGRDNTFRLWSRNGKPLEIFEAEYIDSNCNLFELSNGDLLCWSPWGSLKIWKFPSKISLLPQRGTMIPVSTQWKKRMFFSYKTTPQLAHEWATKQGYEPLPLFENSFSLEGVRFEIDRFSLIAYDKNTGKELSEFRGDAIFTRGIALSNDILVVGDNIGRVLFLKWHGHRKEQQLSLFSDF
jgi:hypothetical protein